MLQEPVAQTSMKIDDQLLLSFSKKASLQVRPKIVSPPEPTALAAAAKPGELGHGPPTTLAISKNKANKLLVFLGRPWPLLHPKFVTARLSPHDRYL